MEVMFFEVSEANIRFSDLKNVSKENKKINEIPVNNFFIFFIGEKKIKTKANPIINLFQFFIEEINLAKICEILL